MQNWRKNQGDAWRRGGRWRWRWWPRLSSNLLIDQDLSQYSQTRGGLQRRAEIRAHQGRFFFLVIRGSEYLWERFRGNGQHWTPELQNHRYDLKDEGEYKYNTLKYKSKDLKYEIDFTNTFIKCPEGELFCNVFSIETTKIDKDLVEDRLKNNRWSLTFIDKDYLRY